MLCKHLYIIYIEVFFMVIPDSGVTQSLFGGWGVAKAALHLEGPRARHRNEGCIIKSQLGGNGGYGVNGVWGGGGGGH